MTITDYIRSELAQISPELNLHKEYETSEVVSWAVCESIPNKRGFNCVSIHLFRDFLYSISGGEIQKPESYNDLFLAYMRYLKSRIEDSLEKHDHPTN